MNLAKTFGVKVYEQDYWQDVPEASLLVDALFGNNEFSFSVRRAEYTRNFNDRIWISWQYERTV
jgi:hypothetical protein